MKKFINNKLVDMTPEEIEEYNNQQQVQPTQEPTLQEQVKLLLDENSMLKECILEMSEIVYGG